MQCARYCICNEAVNAEYCSSSDMSVVVLYRLERNKDREESVSNMEYLKNVVLKVHTHVCLSKCAPVRVCVCV